MGWPCHLRRRCEYDLVVALVLVEDGDGRPREGGGGGGGRLKPLGGQRGRGSQQEAVEGRVRARVRGGGDLRRMEIYYNLGASYFAPFMCLFFFYKDNETSRSWEFG